MRKVFESRKRNFGGQRVTVKQAEKIAFERSAWKNFVRGVLGSFRPGMNPNHGEMPRHKTHPGYDVHDHYDLSTV